jgi:hypothetical protein
MPSPFGISRKAGNAGNHEIKHHGFRVIARKKAQRVRLYSRAGNDLTHRFPLIVETLARLRSRCGKTSYAGPVMSGLRRFVPRPRTAAR